MSDFPTRRELAKMARRTVALSLLMTVMVAAIRELREGPAYWAVALLMAFTNAALDDFIRRTWLEILDLWRRRASRGRDLCLFAIGGNTALAFTFEIEEERERRLLRGASRLTVSAWVVREQIKFVAAMLAERVRAGVLSVLRLGS
jgi:hypothetical protein